MNVLVVAPHADDESLGCAGTLLRHKENGDAVAWLLLTCARIRHGFDEVEELREREQIEKVRIGFPFDYFVNLELAPAQLDRMPLADLTAAIGRVVRDFTPDYLYLPNPSDVHSDHRIAFEASCPATKWFRYPSVKRVATYETVSETEFGISPAQSVFRPNHFVDIGRHLERKLDLLRIYENQMSAFPFPRSEEHIRALAMTRGATAGFRAAEAFQILRDVW